MINLFRIVFLADAQQKKCDETSEFYKDLYVPDVINDANKNEKCIESCNKSNDYAKVCVTTSMQCPPVDEQNANESLAAYKQYKKQAGYQCVDNCVNAEGDYKFAQSATVNTCVADCGGNVWYINNDQICTQGTSCVKAENADLPEGYEKKSQQQCVDKCMNAQGNYKFAQSATAAPAECVESCGNNGQSPAVNYIWYNNGDQICTQQTTCSLTEETLKKFAKKTTKDQCVEKCSGASEFQKDAQEANKNTCVASCGQTEGEKSVAYVWYATDADNICTTETTCSSADDSKTNKLGKQADKQCVTKCDDVESYIQPKDTTVNVCVQSCAGKDVTYVFYQDKDNGLICSDKTSCLALSGELSITYKLSMDNDKKCVDPCGEGQVWYIVRDDKKEEPKENQCVVGACGETNVDEDVKLLPKTTDKDQCVEKCEGEYQFTVEAEPTKCYSQCPENKAYYNQDTVVCIEKCEGEFKYTSGKECRKACNGNDKYYIENTTQCLEKCPTEGDKPAKLHNKDEFVCITECQKDYELKGDVCEKKGNNTGLIVGCVVGAVVVVAVIVVVVVFVVKKKQHKSKDDIQMKSKGKSSKKNDDDDALQQTTN